MRANANNEKFHLINMDGNTCLFSDKQIDRASVPNGVYCYDVRDNGSKDVYFEVLPSIENSKNLKGSIITKVPLAMNEEGFYRPKENPVFYPKADFSIKDYVSTSINNSAKAFSQFGTAKKPLMEQINAASAKKAVSVKKNKDIPNIGR